MSQFHAYDFVYDEVPSHAFDLKIVTFENGGLFSGVGSSDIEILSQQVYRKSKPYYLGRIQKPVLEFELVFGRAQTVTALDRDLISAWLFGRAGYKKLEILQDDLNGTYFKCFFTKPEPLYIGGLNYAFKSKIVCDSPFAYLPSKTVTLSNFSGELNGSMYTVDIYNHSSEDDYLYPESMIITNMFGGNGSQSTSLNIINASDDATRVFSIDPISAGAAGSSIGEIITINNDLQMISSTIPAASRPAEESVLASFNKNWLRLVPKNNTLYFATPVSENGITLDVSITYTERMKIGG